MSKLIDRCKSSALNSEATSTEEDPNDVTSSRDSEINALTSNMLLKILIRLPAESLFSLQFVCKKWFDLINSRAFITSHARQTETVLICNCVPLLNHCGHEEVYEPKNYFRFLDLEDGGNTFVESGVAESFVVQASYDGLILATTRFRNNGYRNSGCRNSVLLMMNPVNRKHMLLPFSTQSRVSVESFGIGFCGKADTYKIVHLFLEKQGEISINILSVPIKCWRRIPEPYREHYPDLKRAPVSIDGTLNWMIPNEGSDYFISLSLKDEKFISKKLPICSSLKDRLLEIGGHLGLATNTNTEAIEVWVLVSEGGDWVKKYSMNVSGVDRFGGCFCCSRNGKRVVVEKGDDFYVYSFESGEMKLIHSCYDRWFYVRRGNHHVAH